MFCSKCGAELADDAKFCSKCGTSIVQEETLEKKVEPQKSHQTEQSSSENEEPKVVNINEAKRIDRLTDRVAACVHPVALACILFSLICCFYIRFDRHALSLVKESSFANYAPNRSIEYLVDHFITSPKWKCRHENDKCFVDVKGKVLYDGKKSKVILTFQVDKKEQDFNVTGLKIGKQEMNDSYSINYFLYTMANQ